MAKLPIFDINTMYVRNALGENNNDVGSLCSPLHGVQPDTINKWGIDRVVTGLALTGTANQRISLVHSSPYRLGDFRNYNHNAAGPQLIGLIPPLWNGQAATIGAGIWVYGAYTITRQIRSYNGSWVTLNSNEVSWFNVYGNPINHSVSHDSVSGQLIGSTPQSSNNFHELDGNISIVVNEWEELDQGNWREFRVIMSHPDDGDTSLKPNHNVITGRQYVREEASIVLTVTPTSLEFESLEGTAPSSAKTISISSSSSLSGMSIYVSKEDISGHGTNWFDINTSNIQVGTSVTRDVTVSAWSGIETRAGQVKFQLREVATQKIYATKTVYVQHVILR